MGEVLNDDSKQLTKKDLENDFEDMWCLGLMGEGRRAVCKLLPHRKDELAERSDRNDARILKVVILTRTILTLVWKKTAVKNSNHLNAHLTEKMDCHH